MGATMRGGIGLQNALGPGLRCHVCAIREVRNGRPASILCATCTPAPRKSAEGKTNRQHRCHREAWSASSGGASLSGCDRLGLVTARSPGSPRFMSQRPPEWLDLLYRYRSMLKPLNQAQPSCRCRAWSAQTSTIYEGCSRGGMSSHRGPLHSDGPQECGRRVARAQEAGRPMGSQGRKGGAPAGSASLGT